MEEENIREGLSRSRRYIARLRALWETHGRSDFLERIEVRYFTEKLIQLTLESLLDVGSLIAAGKCSRKPEDYVDVFNVMGEEGLIPAEKAEKFEGIARFRDALARSPGDLSQEELYEVLETGLSDLEEMVETYVKILEG